MGLVRTVFLSHRQRSDATRLLAGLVTNKREKEQQVRRTQVWTLEASGGRRRAAERMERLAGAERNSGALDRAGSMLAAQL